MIEHKNVDVRWKGLSDSSGEVELYAAVFGNVDRAGERIEPFAFKNLAEFVREGWLTINHDWDRLPIATVDSAMQDGKGLKILAHFHGTSEAQAVRTTVRERIERGKSVAASIGYKVLADEQVKVSGKSVRSLKALSLFEASIVSVGCNAEAGVIGAKSRSHGSGTAAWAEALREYWRIRIKFDPGLRLAVAARGTGPTAKAYGDYLALCAKYNLPVVRPGR